jgi:HSP20 family protein
MMLTSWDPFKGLQDYERAARAATQKKAFAPAANISQDERGYLLRFDVPGVSKDEIDIDVDKGVLVVHGERKSFIEDSDEKHHRVESYSGSFSRSFRLPEDADETLVTATQKDGVLTVRVPRAESTLSRKVEIADA